MRQLHTFLLTVLLDDHDPDLFCGRVRFVATDQEANFNGVAELISFVRTQIEKYAEIIARDSPVGEGESAP